MSMPFCVSATTVLNVPFTALNGLTVTVSNRRPLVLPATLEVTYTDGSKERIRIPAEAWLSKGAASFRFAGNKPATTVTIDPDHVLPDDDRTNNTFKLP